jgi:2-oxoglutarate dehydrogenase E2 component (dihydrolipoamide succinyltransferase)
MKSEVVVPEVGESVSSGILASWLKEDGEAVSEGDELFELETDKATLAVPAPADGVLSIQVPEDTEVQVGQTVAVVDSEGAAGESGGTSSEAGAAASGGAGDSRGAAASAAAGESGGGQEDLSPAVRRIVAEHGLDVSKISGSGKNGRILKDDALKAVEEQKSTAGDAGGGGTSAPSGGGGTAAASGGGGTSATSGGGAAARPEAPAAQRKAAPAVPSTERQRRVKMSTLRKRIAENMVASKQNAAHLTTFNEVDMSAVSALRKSYRDDFEEKYGVKLGFMSFFVKAACAALAEYPEVNAFVDGEEIVYNDYYNIGVALSSDRGLIVPVLREADGLSFAEIEQQILDFIKRAQNRRIMPDELSGGTFTISNGGVFGSMLSTPIPNPPQTAVLGMHSIQQRPVAVDGEVLIRPMMYLALTYDHRIIDGREAVRFLVKIKELIEDPRKMLLEL